MALPQEIGRRMNSHYVDSEMIRIIKDLDALEEKEAEARTDDQRVVALSHEFENIERIEGYLKVKFARMSTVVKHEETIIKAQLEKIRDAKQKLQRDMRHIPRETPGEVRQTYAVQVSRLDAGEQQLSALLKHVQQFRRAIRDSCIETVRTFAKIRWWA